MNDEILEWLTNESNIKTEAEREINGMLVMFYQLGLVDARMVNGEPMFTLSQTKQESNLLNDPIASAITMYGLNLQAAEA